MTDEPAGPTEHTAWWKYIQSLMDVRSLTGTEFARRLGSNPSLINSWRDRGAEPRLDLVRKVSAEFGRPLTEVMVAAGMGTWEEFGQTAPQIALNEVPNAQLASELARRLGVSRAEIARAMSASDEDIETDQPAAGATATKTKAKAKAEPLVKTRTVRRRGTDHDD